MDGDLNEARTWSEHECKGPETGACLVYVKNSKKNGMFETELARKRVVANELQVVRVNMMKS